MRLRVFAILAVVIAILFAIVTRQLAAPGVGPHPEVSRIVNLMQGSWTGKMTAVVPGFPAETFDWKMNCQSVAQGAGLSCTNTGKASIGSMAESCLLAYDPEGKAIHYMCVTSMGEVHDHKGKWSGFDTIEFEPLHGGFNGQPITETLKWQFRNDDTIEKTSEVKLADRSTMKFEFNGKRVSALSPAK
jgi:hypothetical protein